MAKLTKQQQAELDQLREDATVAKALSWPTEPEPTPLARPEDRHQTIHGWEINEHSVVVAERWQTSIATFRNSGKTGGSRSMPKLYANLHDAYLALHFALCQRYAKELANVIRTRQELSS